MKWNIITGSSCDLLPEQGDGEVGVSSVPFRITVGQQEFIDDGSLDTENMLHAMEDCPEVSRTACPSPQGWLEQFERAEQSIAIAISSRLSGSLGSAVAARAMVLEQDPGKKIAVLDSRSTGPELALCVEKIRQLIAQGLPFDRVVVEADAYLRRTRVVFALSSFDNLVKSGRMSRLSCRIARALGMWGIGVGNDEGAISIKGRVRGAAKAAAALMEDMAEHGFRGGEVVISHCQNPALAERLRSAIQERWHGSRVRILPTRGLCSFYAERGGLIMSY